MAGNGKVYNINAIRPALVKMRENGNRTIISKKLCSELGISENYYRWYKDGVEKLFEAVCSYCRLKNSPNAKPAEVTAAHEAIYPLWKDMLSTAERDKLKRELRVTEHDVSNLVSFCQVFVDDKNDTSRGKDETFAAHKVWATMPIKQFQKKVETDLGIRIAQVEVLSDDERDFLRAERKILMGWSKAERRIGEIAANKERLVALKTKLKGDEAKALLDEQIADMDAQVAALNQKIEDFKKKHETLLNPPQAEVAADEPKPKKQKAKKAEVKKTEPVTVEAEMVVVKKTA